MNPRCELVPGKPYPVICRGRPTTAVRARRFRPPALLYSTAVRRPNVSGGCHLTLDCKKRADCRILWLLDLRGRPRRRVGGPGCGRDGGQPMMPRSGRTLGFLDHGDATSPAGVSWRSLRRWRQWIFGQSQLMASCLGRCQASEQVDTPAWPRSPRLAGSSAYTSGIAAIR